MKYWPNIWQYLDKKYSNIQIFEYYSGSRNGNKLNMNINIREEIFKY